MAEQTSSTDQSESPSRVAVIAIHGVGEHHPGAMAAAVAQQLLGVCGDRYSHASYKTVTLDTDADGLSLGCSQNRATTGTYSRKRLRNGFGSGFLNRRGSLTDDDRSHEHIDQQFTTALLLDGEGCQSTYTTSSHSLKRRLDGSDIVVDVHELHWADLSHGSVSGSLKIFDQFTQLLLHIASLGRTTLATLLAAAQAGNGTGSRRWKSLYSLSALGYWLFAMPILQGNLLFLLLAGLLLPAIASTGDKVRLAATAISVGVGLALLAGRIAWRYLAQTTTNVTNRSLALIPASVLAGILGGCLVVWQWDCIQPYSTLLIAVIEAPLLLYVGHALMRRYDRIRPGALLLWTILSSALTVAGLGIAFCLPHLTYLTWLGHLTEVVYAFLVVVWIVLFVVNASLLCCAALCRFIGNPSRERRRATSTALLAASLPAPLLLSVILALWAASFDIFHSIIPDKIFIPWFADPLFPYVGTTAEFMRTLIENSATHVFIPYLILMAVAALLVAWGLLPSIKAEIVRPPLDSQSIVEKRPQTLGRWLDGAFLSMIPASVLAGIGFFLLLPYGVTAQALGWQSPSIFFEIDFDWMLVIGEAVGGTAVGFLAATQMFSGAFSNFFGRLRVIVDAALDVDNWLRERPRGNTPRLQIFSRFNGLLRHLESEHKYDRIVIVAHSQGTVVATDFLRYLKHQTPDRLSKLPPIHLVTMGSPLRQLYARRFPFLYAWVVDGHGPVPADCGVARWINIYGSGDYVGRNLWTTQDRWTLSQPSGDPTVSTLDVCVGPHAHTHYLDPDNALVGKWIDAVI